MKRNNRKDQRPEFMITLGLSPPYTLEDVKQAYLQKVKSAHPDHGGRPGDFIRLQGAFERAGEFVRFRASRRDWIRIHVERYLEQERVLAELKKLGARVQIQQIRWMNEWFGDDFAQLVDRLIGIHLHGPQIDDTVLDYLVKEHQALRYVHLLDLAGSRIGDGALPRLRALPTLRCLDLRDVPVSYRGVASLLRCSRKIRWLQLRGTKVGWWGRLKLHWRFRRVKLIASKEPHQGCLKCSGNCGSESPRLYSP